MTDVEKQYYAFISYRHLDNTEPGRQWATWLHQAIETYEIPGELVGRRNSRGEEIPASIFPVFRDEEALPADSDLSNVITRALDRTRFLIVLCSPNARQSSFVADEIRYFKQLGRSDRIIAAMIDGEPNVSLDAGKRAQGFALEDECFPEPLQFVTDADGRQTEERTEPVAADFRITMGARKVQGWTSPQALRDHLVGLGTLDRQQIGERVEEYERQLHLMLLKVIAGIIGVPLDDLTQRDKAHQLALEQQRARRLRRWLSGVAVLAAVAIGAGAIAWQQKQVAVANEALAQEQSRIARQNEQRAVAERNQSLISQSRFLLDQARQENARGQHDLALLLGLNAVPGVYGGDRPMPRSVAELRRAVLAGNRPLTIKASDDVQDAGFIGDGDEFFVRTDSPSVRIHDSGTGRLVDHYTHDGDVYAVAASRDGTLLAVASEYRDLVVWDRAADVRLHEFEMHGPGQEIRFGHDGKSLFTSSRDGRLEAWDLSTGKQRFSVDAMEYSVDHLSVSRDGALVLGQNNFSSGFRIWSGRDGALLHEVARGTEFMRATRRPFINRDGTSVVYYDSSGTHVYDLESRQSREASAQQHLMFSRSGGLFVVLPASAQIQGDADDIHRIESYRTAPVLWNNETQQGFTLNHLGDVTDVHFTPDDQYVVTVVFGTANFWHPDSGTKSHAIKLAGNPLGLRFSRDGQRLLNHDSSEDGVSVWAVEPAWKERPLPYPAYWSRLNLSPGGNHMFIPASDESTPSTVASTVDPAASVALKPICTDFNFGEFSRDGRRLLINCGHRSGGHVYDTATGAVRYHITPEQYQRGTRMSPDGGTLAFPLGRYEDGDLRLVHVDTPDEEPVIVDLGLGRDPSALRFSHDSRMVALRYGDRRLVFVDAATGAAVNRFEAEVDIDAFDFGEDNRSFFVSHGDGQIVEYSMRDNAVGRRIPLDQPVEQVIAVPERELLLLVLRSGSVGFWSTRDQTLQELVATGVSDATYHLSPSRKYLIKDGGRPVVISVAGQGMFYTSESYDVVDIAVDEPRDEIVILSKQSVRRVPALTRNVAEQATQYVPAGRRCLTAEERNRYFLPALTAEQKRARGCAG